MGGTVKLAGENEYRKALKQITDSLKQMSTELKLSNIQFEVGDKSIKQTKNEYEGINSKINEQKDNIKNLKDVLKNLTTEYGENSIQVQKMKSQLNGAEIKLYDMEKQTKDSTKQLYELQDGEEKVGKSSIKMGDLIKANVISEAIIGGFKKLTSVVAELRREFFNFVRDGIESASNLQEAQNVVDVTFGKSAETIDAWSKKAANSYGISELNAKKYNGTLGAMLKSMQLNDKKVLEMSTSLTGLVADFASFYNLDHETSFNKIRSGISGETEPLKQLGINMSVANLETFALSSGLKKTYNTMSEAEKTTLRYNYLMKVSADAQGDFARTSGSYANQHRIAELNMQNLSNTIGSKLLPVVNQALTIFNGLFGGTTNMSEGISQLTTMISSIAEELIKELPKFTEFAFQLVKNLVEGISSNFPKIINSANQIISLFFSGLVEKLPEILNFGLGIVTSLSNTIIENLPTIIESGVTLLLNLVQGLVSALPNLIPIAITAIFTLVESLLNNIDVIIDASIQLVIALADGLITALPIIIEKAPIIIEKIVDALARNLPKISQAGFDLTIKLGEGLIKAIPKINEKIPIIIMSLFESIMSYKDKMMEIGKNLIMGIGEGIAGAKDWLIDKVKELCGKTTQAIKDFFGIKSPSKLMEKEVGNYLAEGIGVGFTGKMSKISKDMQNSIPTNFDVTSNLNSKTSELSNFKSMFKEVFSEFKPNVILDGKVVGEFSLNYVNTRGGLVY